MKLKKAIFTLFFLINITVFSQTITEKNLIGTWKVINLSGETPPALNKEHQIKLDELINAFKNASFEFKKNKTFNFNIDFVELGEMLKNKKWEFDTENFKVNIKDNTDNGLLMVIDIVKNKDQFMFLLSETPFILEVEKL